MGGALCFAAAATLREGIISAISPFYGVADQKKYNLLSIKIPIQGHFGKYDRVEGLSDLKVRGCYSKVTHD